MLKLSNVMIGSDNPRRLVEFYTRVLGEPSMTESGYTGWMLGGCFFSIGEHSEVHGQNSTPGRLIFFLDTEDVKGEFDRLKGVGATVIKEPYDMGEQFSLATLADPDGNYFQLATPYEVPAQA
ncbi:MAG: VOC family protein [Candidatus Dormibacteraeota bacterium]|nr:VOC family protein [Candidatus Dormibacteraeota bacterium]MBV9525572.1 VOC family protein [Candidatus Dormibacteraeota bacterium]